MRRIPGARSIARGIAVGAGFAAGLYAAYVAMAWTRYGHASPPTTEDEDPLLDRFMPRYDVVERHHVRVAAPAAVTLAAAKELDLLEQPIVRAIFRAREVILGAKPDAGQRPHGLLAEVQSLGWVILDEAPDREVVVGAVTKPWEANPAFRSVPPAEFAAFDEPDYVKIAWTLRADAQAPQASVFRMETRAVATDAGARARFRRYWAFLSPGIILIRWASLRPLKAEAERRVRATSGSTGTSTPGRLSGKASTSAISDK